jgi:hypothetical protein
MRILLLLALSVGLLLGGCMRMTSVLPEEEDEAPSKVTAKDLEPTVEARQFFTDPNCVAWTEGFSLDDLKTLTNDLYAAGSPKVMFAGADEIEGKKVSAWFVAELPKDKSARQRCVDVWNKTFKDSDYEVKAGDDIDYLDFMMD